MRIKGAFSPYQVAAYSNGDCVDRAVEIRKKLREKGLEAELVVGILNGEGHCWVRFRKDKTDKWENIWNY